MLGEEMIFNKILEETGKQFVKKVLQHAIYEVSSNLIVKGVETAFEIYKQRKLMEMSLEYQEQVAPLHAEEMDEEDEEVEEKLEEPPPKRKPNGKRPKKQS